MQGPSFPPSFIMKIWDLKLDNIGNNDVEFSRLLLFEERALTNFGGPENSRVLPHPGVPGCPMDFQNVWHPKLLQMSAV